MSTLLVVATAFEVAPILPALSISPERAVLHSGRFRDDRVDVLVTGVGMVATAVWCSKILTEQRYDFALNLGVCGSFDDALAPGSVVHVVSDRLIELGAEDGDGFLTLQQMQLLAENEFPYTDGQLVDATRHRNRALDLLPRARGITVNTVHGAEASIAKVKARFDPQVESMEGAAFMYASLVAGVPCAQVRSVSNRVERRNKAAWKMPQAIENLGRAALAILEAR